MKMIAFLIFFVCFLTASLRAGDFEDKLDSYRKSKDYHGYVSTLIKWSRHLLESGNVAEAELKIDKAVEAAKLLQDKKLEVVALNCLANIKSAQGFYHDALNDYKLALEKCINAPSQELMISLNMVRLYFKLNKKPKASQLLKRMAGELYLNTNIKVVISVVRYAQQLEDYKLGKEILDNALTRNKVLNQHHNLMLLHLEYAKLHIASKNYSSAEKNLKRTLYQASFLLVNQELYQIYGLMATCLEQKQKYDQAIVYYQKAIAHASKNRISWTSSPIYHNRLKKIPQLYGQYIHCLIVSGNPSEKRLKEICQLMTELKTCELENYFRDDLVIEFEQKDLSLKELAGKDSALVYTITMDKQLALIVYKDGQYHLTLTDVSHAQLSQALIQLRLLCQTNSLNINRQAKELYIRMIKPIKPLLNGAKHIVFIPDTPLQSFPWALLHDGSNFLIEQYSISTASGLKMSPSGRLKPDDSDILIAGLTSGLPSVLNELKAINSLYPGDALIDDKLSKQSLEFKLRNNFYRIIHLATHADFSSENRQHYLQTGDGKMDMKEFEQWIKMSSLRDDGVELLTLSACKTAVGDELNNMGLAGTAIRSGAKSVLASLWPVDDKATAFFMTEFYKHLKSGDSKATALQKVQQAFIRHKIYHSPYYWAPFTLIGNWL